MELITFTSMHAIGVFECLVFFLGTKCQVTVRPYLWKRLFQAVPKDKLFLKAFHQPEI